ncbi:hypothetical protein ACQ4PT_026427 [Festuca glaucescens]
MTLRKVVHYCCRLPVHDSVLLPRRRRRRPSNLPRVWEMADALDMSLDDLITKNKSSSQSQSRRGRRNPASAPASASGGSAPTGRRFQARAATRAAAAPYHQVNFRHQAPPAYAYASQAQQMPMVEAPSVAESGKLYISNLDYNVSNEDIKELFSEVGDVERYSINYDKSGRSKGTAEVVFTRRSDALAALKRYNNVQLDGKPMKIEFIGTNIAAQAPAIFTLNTPALGNFNFPPRSAPGGDVGGRGWPRGRGGFVGGGRGRGWPRGGGGFGERGRGRGAVVRGRGRGGRGSQPVSANDLDADLDKYHLQAMQTS